MHVKQKIQTSLLSLSLLIAPLAIVTTPSMVSAGTSKCGGVETSIISCDEDNKGDKVENNAIWGLLLMVLNILTIGIGIVAVGGIVYAAILYTTAQDKAAQVTQAKETIFNVVLGLVMFALMYAFLQFLIPGGIFA